MFIILKEDYNLRELLEIIIWSEKSTIMGVMSLKDHTWLVSLRLASIN